MQLCFVSAAGTPDRHSVAFDLKRKKPFPLIVFLFSEQHHAVMMRTAETAAHVLLLQEDIQSKQSWGMGPALDFLTEQASNLF